MHIYYRFHIRHIKSEKIGKLLSDGYRPYRLSYIFVCFCLAYRPTTVVLQEVFAINRMTYWLAYFACCWLVVRPTALTLAMENLAYLF